MFKKKSRLPLTLCRSAILLLSISTLAQAETRYTVSLSTDQSQPINIGQLTITEMNRENGFEMVMNDAVFSNHFLSMRPFKCLSDKEGSKTRMLCHVPYPYENKRLISQDTLTDLEYDLMFIARSAKEYGIDSWNGRYFRLRWEEDTIIGEIQEVDLNVLAAPPEDGNLRPVTYDDLSPAEQNANKWTPVMSIVPE